MTAPIAPKSDARGRLAMRAAGACAIAVGTALCSARASWQAPARGGDPALFEWGFLGATRAVGPKSIERAAEFAAGPLRILVLAVALTVGILLARRLRPPGSPMGAVGAVGAVGTVGTVGAVGAGPPPRAQAWLWGAALGLAIFYACDPGLFAFVARRATANAAHYLAVEHALRGLGAVVVLAGVLALWPGRGGPWLALQRRGRTTALGLVLAGIVAAGVPEALRQGPLEGLPVTNDGVAYEFQAELFAAGTTHLEHTPFQAFYPARQIWPGSDAVPRVFAKYPPGHSLVLAAGRWLGFERLFIVLGAFFLPALTFSLARAVSAPAPLLAAWFTALSPALAAAFSTSLAFGSSVPFAAAALAAGAHAIRRARKGESALLLALAAGLCIGGLGLSRPGSAVAIGAALLIAAFAARPTIALRAVWPAVMGASPAALALALFSRATTGDPWLTGYTLYAQTLSPDDLWGLANLHLAVHNSAFNVARASTWLLGLGGGLVLCVLGARALEQRALPVAAPLALLAFYSLLTFHGVPWAGPVYLLEGFGALAILAAAGVYTLLGNRPRGNVVWVLAGCAGASAMVLGHQIPLARHAVLEKHAPLLAARAAGIVEGIVFVQLDSSEAQRRVPLPPPRPNTVLVFARDLGAANDVLIEARGNPPTWRFDPADPDARLEPFVLLR